MLKLGLIQLGIDDWNKCLSKKQSQRRKKQFELWNVESIKGWETSLAILPFGDSMKFLTSWCELSLARMRLILLQLFFLFANSKILKSYLFHTKIGC